MQEPIAIPSGLVHTSHEAAVLAVLSSIRAVSDAIDRMHGAMKADMQMNATDLAALRMLIVREQRGVSISPHQLAAHLRISTASTTKLLDRLSAAGHIERRPHPVDRRARIVVLTEESRQAFYRNFGPRLSAMREVAGEYGEDDLAVIARFLDQLSSALGDD